MMMMKKKVEDFLIGLVGGKENKTQTERFVQKKQEAIIVRVIKIKQKAKIINLIIIKFIKREGEKKREIQRFVERKQRQKKNNNKIK